MIRNQVISITELRTNATQIINSLHGLKYVFVNNKPKSVIMDIKSYEKMQKELQQKKFIEEVEYAKKNNPRFDNVDDVMKDLGF